MSASDSPCGFYHIGTLGESVFVLEAIEYRAGFGIKKKKYLVSNSLMRLCGLMGTLLKLSGPLLLYV